MLSKSDLSQIQKAVKDVVRAEVASEARSTRQELVAEMKLLRMRLEERLYSLENKVKDLDIRIDANSKDIKNIKSNVRKIKKTMEMMSGFLDKEDVKLRKRVERMENHLNIVNN